MLKCARSLQYLLLMTFLWIWCSACNTTKFLQTDELLLKGNAIKIRKDAKIANKRNLQYELEGFFKQQPNSRYFLIPREWVYFKSNDPSDTTRFDRWKKRVIAQEPAIYQDELTQAAAEDMQLYLQKKGYYEANVFADELVRNKKIYVTYYLDPGLPLLIDSVEFSTKDGALQSLLGDLSQGTLLKKGEIISESLFESEKKRITGFLRNNGFADFDSYYIAPLEADTTETPQGARLYLELLPPVQADTHRVFNIGQVSIYPNFDAAKPATSYRDSVIQGFLFKLDQEDNIVYPAVIARSIYLQPGERYSQEKINRTRSRLSLLGIYKFVKIEEQANPLDSSLVDIRIELTPNKKLATDLNFELNYTNRSTTSGSGNLLGIFLGPVFRNRNAFKGAELAVTNLSAGLEIDPRLKGNRFWNTVDLGIQTEIILPKFLDYFNLWKSINRLSPKRNRQEAGDSFYQLQVDNATSRFSASYNYLQVLDFYQYNLFNASFGYNLQRGSTKRYILNHIAVDFLQPSTQPAFEALLAVNPFLERSFGNQLFVGLLFRDFSYFYTGRKNERGESTFLGVNLELAGAEIWAGNALYNRIAARADTLSIGETDFSQYWKTDLDLRYYRDFSPKQSVATRVNVGIARPFGFTSDVPYVKQFYVGGPNSIRAWVQRGLGPGGYLDTLAQDPANRFRLNPGNRFLLYQTGDLKLEFNAEYRFDIFWMLKGAIFLDAGNIWTLKRDPDRCGSQFLLRKRVLEECGPDGLPMVNDPFYKQIAVGTGAGIRLDFSFFIIRLDMGMKLRYPFPRNLWRGPVNEAQYWEDFRGWGLRDLTFNLGFGYPF